MKIVYFQDPQGNFGDELNRWLWPRILGDAVTGFTHHGSETRSLNNAEDLLFYGIGTILDDRIPPVPEKIIFGSGFGYGRKPESLAACTIFFVRGENTAQVLGIPPDKALTDPAILLRRFFPVVQDADKRHDISFMPHHSSAAGEFWKKACEELGIHYISPRGFDVESTIREISASRLLIAEAMHGAIVADAFRVPWVAVSSVRETNNFKWQDWCSSMKLVYAPVRFTPIFQAPGKKPLKALLNCFKQQIRRLQLATVANARSASLLSDGPLLDAHRLAMDLRVRELQDYLLQRGTA